MQFFAGGLRIRGQSNVTFAQSSPVGPIVGMNLETSTHVNPKRMPYLIVLIYSRNDFVPTISTAVH